MSSLPGHFVKGSSSATWVFFRFCGVCMGAKCPTYTSETKLKPLRLQSRKSMKNIEKHLKDFKRIIKVRGRLMQCIHDKPSAGAPRPLHNQMIGPSRMREAPPGLLEGCGLHFGFLGNWERKRKLLLPLDLLLPGLHVSKALSQDPGGY